MREEEFRIISLDREYRPKTLSEFLKKIKALKDSYFDGYGSIHESVKTGHMRELLGHLFITISKQYSTKKGEHYVVGINGEILRIKLTKEHEIRKTKIYHKKAKREFKSLEKAIPFIRRKSKEFTEALKRRGPR